MRTEQNRILVFRQTSEAQSQSVVSTQLMNAAQQLERIIFHASAYETVEFQVFGLSFVPRTLAEAILYGNPVIDDHSNSRFVTQGIHPLVINTRKIYENNPICLCVTFLNVSETDTECEVIVECHDYVPTHPTKVFITEEFQDGTIIDNFTELQKLPSQFVGWQQIWDFIRTELQYIWTRDSLKSSELASVRTSLYRAEKALSKLPPETDFRTIWDELKRLFAGTIFSSFFSEANRQFILEKCEGD